METTIDREQMDTEVQTDWIMCVIFFFAFILSLSPPSLSPLESRSEGKWHYVAHTFST